jgi:hypothetical protein
VGSVDESRRVGIGTVTVVVAVLLSAAALGCVASPGPESGRPQPTPSMAQPSPTASGSTNLDPTGILLVGVGEEVQARPASEAMAQAFDLAWRFAQAHPMDIGYPWIDPLTGELVLSAATAEGRTLLAAAATFTVQIRIRDVAHSYAELQQIQDDATRLLAAGVVDAQLIYMTLPDHRDDRTLITISRMSRPLLEELARRFGADAIAIQVAPH